MNETTTTRRRRQFSAEDRRRWTEQYERSGLSVRDFCRDHPLCQSSLSRWLRQRRTATQKPSQAGSLVEVRVTPAPVMGSGASVTVRLPGGVTMEVPSGTEVTWLATSHARNSAISSARVGPTTGTLVNSAGELVEIATDCPQLADSAVEQRALLA